MIVALSFTLAVLGFTLLALSLARHYRDIFGKTLSPMRGRTFRTAGCLLMAASMASAITAQGIGTGLVLWFALLTVAALIVGLSITYRDKWWRI